MSQKNFLCVVNIFHHRTCEKIGQRYVIIAGNDEEDVRNKVEINETCAIAFIEEIDTNKGYTFSVFGGNTIYDT